MPNLALGLVADSQLGERVNVVHLVFLGLGRGLAVQQLGREKNELVCAQAVAVPLTQRTLFDEALA